MGQAAAIAKQDADVFPAAAATKSPSPSGESFTRAQWIAAARKALIRDGIAGVKINVLAKRLGVTRGGFYWRFSGLNDLLDALLENWRETNTDVGLRAIQGPGDPIERFTRLMRVWIDEVEFDPSYDLAVRDWARVSKKADKAVRQMDKDVIEALAGLFRDAGHAADEAAIRARIVHYHQVGYYAMRVKRRRAERYATADLYIRILTGSDRAFFGGATPD